MLQLRNICHKGESVTPPGEYLESRVAGWGIRVHEFAEEYCQKVEPAEGCVLHNNERPEKSANYLAPGYKELYQTIERARDVDHYFDEVHESYLVFIYAWKPLEKESERYGAKNEGEPDHGTCSLGEFPVNCATGNQFVTQTDLAVGGRGPALGLTRTYNSLLALIRPNTAFGYGWTGSYSAHLELNYKGREATVYQNNGSTVTFARAGTDIFGEGGTELGFTPEGPWTASSSLTEATLVDEGSGMSIRYRTRQSYISTPRVC